MNRNTHASQELDEQTGAIRVTVVANTINRKPQVGLGGASVASAKQKYVAAAQKYVQKGNLARGIKEYQRALAESPGDLRILLKIGDLQAKTNAVDDAISTYRKVAKTHLKSGFLQKAAAVYKKALQLQPEHVKTLISLGDIYHQQGLLSDAMAFYNKAVQVVGAAGDASKYLELLQKMSRVDPSNVGIRIKIAEHLSKTGDHDGALNEFRVACESLKEVGRIDDYIKVAERLLYHDKTDYGVVHELARTYLEKNEPRRALGKLQLCFENGRQDPIAHELLVEVFMKLGETEKAVQVMRENARVLTANSDFDAAKEMWKKLLRLRPNDPEATAATQQAAPLLSSDLLAPVAVEPVQPQLQQPMSGGGLGAPQPTSSVSINIPGQVQTSHPPSSTTALPTPKPVSKQIKAKLVEVDSFLRYRLFEQALEALQQVFALDSENLDAMERLKDIHVQCGYYPQAVDSLLHMTMIANRTDPMRAETYLSQAIEMIPDHAGAIELAETLGFTHLISYEAYKADSVEIMVAEFAADDLENLGDVALDEDEKFATDMFNVSELAAGLDDLDDLDVLESIDESVLDEEIEVLDDFDLDSELDELDDDVFAVDDSETLGGDDEELLEVGGGRDFENHTFVGAVDRDFVRNAEKLRLDLEEADFYYQQRMYNEAYQALQRINANFPNMQEVQRRLELVQQALYSQSTPPGMGHHSQNNTPVPAQAPQPQAGATVGDNLLTEHLIGKEELSSHFELGLAYREMQLHEDAISEFQIAIQEGAQVPHSLVLIGQSLLETGHINEAIQHFQQGIRYATNYPVVLIHAMYRAGLAYEVAGHPNEAMQYFRQIAGYQDMFPDLQQRMVRLQG